MHRPHLTVAGTPAMSTLYDAAMDNLQLNTVDSPSGRFVRAGGGYADPWTRDASINAWGAASILEPGVARDTLLRVCDRQQDGRRIIAQDNQWWDQIIWVIAAWQHYLVTGDTEFLAEAYQIGTDSLAILNRDRYRPQFGLYAGGALMQDGISGYPQPPNEPGRNSSFVLDYPAARELMCLSTNALYSGAHRSLAAMATRLGADPEPFTAAADELVRAVNDRLWIEETGLYGYFLHADGEIDRHQEAAGLALAVTFGVADADQRERVLSGIHRERYGVVNVWPHFPERYSDERPGRHNGICWPMVMGLFGDAAAQAGRADVLAAVLEDLRALVQGSDNHFFELYNATTGAVDGGWQSGHRWESLPDQTWSATAYLRLSHTGLLGARYAADGLRFAPTVPEGMDRVELTGFPYRGATLDIDVTGTGSGVRAVALDGSEIAGPAAVPADLTGSHRVSIRMGD
ncbi:MAG TPA: glycosyl hydrolase family 65 protein [Mycobacteriales bacterium]|nr:glycosyl hydrolase family 65 protein [Mycobacteriales bacterium]